MATKNILLVITDAQAAVDINQALGDEWLTTPATSEADALALLEAGSFDALIADFNLGDSDASELLNQALDKCPEMTRFLLAYEADLALVAAKVNGAHEILPKPIDPDSFKNRIESAFSDSCPEQTISAADCTPAAVIPPVYDEVLTALNSPDVTCEQVGKIIATDDALIEEVLTLTRSTYLGLPSKIIEPVDAVELLGLETVKALVMALKFLAEHSHVRPGYLSTETIWQHSTRVAQIARDLVLFETKDRVLASQALAAGLLHDLGKVVLATNYDDLYGRVHSLARKQPVPLWEIEKEMFGASHGEIGACLLGMWNMPIAIVDAVAFHHEPPLGEHDHLSPLAAVHIANVLEQQIHPSDEFRVVPVMSTPFLNELGLLRRLPIWRATFGNQSSRAKATETVEADPLAWVVAAAETSAATRSANQLPAPATATQTTTSSSESFSWLNRSVFIGAAAGILFAVFLGLQLGLDSTAPLHVHAQTLDSRPAMLVAHETSAPETAPAIAAEPTPVVEPEAAPVVSVSPAVSPATPAPEASATNAPAVSEPPVVSEAVVTNIAPASLPPKETAPAFRLNGIIYGVANPSAVVNGKAVYVGEKVNGAKVISISRNEVALEINGERKTLSIPVH